MDSDAAMGDKFDEIKNSSDAKVDESDNEHSIQSTSGSNSGSGSKERPIVIDSEKDDIRDKKLKNPPGCMKKRKYRTRNQGKDESDEGDLLTVEGDVLERQNADNMEDESEIVDTGSFSVTFQSKRSNSKISPISYAGKKRKKVSLNKKLGQRSHTTDPEFAQKQNKIDPNNDENELNKMDESNDVPVEEKGDGSDDTAHRSRSGSSSSSSSSSSTCIYEEDGDEENDNSKEELTDDEEWLKKHTDTLASPSWRAVEQLWKREYGCQSRFWQSKAIGSHGLVQRFERQYTLNGHQGCVNALHFNRSGTLLASGSDDLVINIWDFLSSDSEPYISYNSGHRSNIFQAKFMPNSSDLTVISCARDGQVRIGYLSSTGSCRDTKKLAQHRGSAHKLGLDSAGCKSTFFSCGEDSVVMQFDLRENKPAKKLLSVKEGDSKIPLYAIDTSPRMPSQFAVSGRDEWARVYDIRMLNQENPEVFAKYSPHHMQKSPSKANITCLVYNHNGEELLCSYNDEDIYLFDATHSTGDDFKRKYKGHRNNATVKGVNFYGPMSEFIVSGSDCGNIFLWDKESSQVVQFMQGDEGGVVNVLEPHPNLPILATSGLDSNIKIWGPTGNGELDQEKLKKLMLNNRQERHEEFRENNVIDSHLLWFLMRSLRNARGRRPRADAEDDSSDSSSSGTSGSDDGDDDGERRRLDYCLTS